MFADPKFYYCFAHQMMAIIIIANTQNMEYLLTAMKEVVCECTLKKQDNKDLENELINSILRN